MARPDLATACLELEPCPARRAGAAGAAERVRRASTHAGAPDARAFVDGADRRAAPARRMEPHAPASALGARARPAGGPRARSAPRARRLRRRARELASAGALGGAAADARRCRPVAARGRCAALDSGRPRDRLLARRSRRRSGPRTICAATTAREEIWPRRLARADRSRRPSRGGHRRARRSTCSRGRRSRGARRPRYGRGRPRAAAAPARAPASPTGARTRSSARPRTPTR